MRHITLFAILSFIFNSSTQSQTISPPPVDGSTSITLSFAPGASPAGYSVAFYGVPLSSVGSVGGCPTDHPLPLDDKANNVIQSTPQTVFQLKNPLGKDEAVCVVLTAPSNSPPPPVPVVAIADSGCAYFNTLPVPSKVRSSDYRVTRTETPPPTDPAAVADTTVATDGFTFSTKTSDSFKKEVSVTVGLNTRSHCDPPMGKDKPAWQKNQTVVKNLADRLSPRYSRTTFNVNLSYDDQWKDGPPALSNVTQTYSTLAVNLSKLTGVRTSLLGDEYHSNQQGIVLEQEYGIGWYDRILTGRSITPTSPSSGSSVPVARNTFLIAPQIRLAFDALQKAGDAVNAGPGIYIQDAVQITSATTLTVVFKGYAPVESFFTNGRASASVNYNYQITKKLSFTVNTTDTYFSSVPSGSPGYRNSSFSSTIGVKYNPAGK